MKKRILVAGGLGFLGSHLCKRLLSLGSRVIAVDNLSTGSLENVKDFKSGDFSFVNMDICEPLDFEVDEIYNLASPASPVHYQKDPIFTMKTNIIGSFNLLELARREGARIFQASTSEVYGDPKVHPQDEGYFGNVNITGKRACYDEGKRAAEAIFFDYNREHRVPIRVCRIFNTYGPRMQRDDGRAVSNFIVQALRGEDLTVYGDGRQTRSFCYVDDLVEGFLRFMDSGDIGPMNLGNPREVTVLELANLIIEMTDSKSRVVFRDLPFDDPKRRRPDIGRAKELLGWEPKVSLKEGLFKTVEYFKESFGCLSF